MSRIKAFLPLPLFLLLGVAACFLGNVLPVPVYDTPLSLSLSNVPAKDGKRQCFYFTGLMDDDGRILVNPTQLLRESSVHEHVFLVNQGAGLWIDLSGGASFRLDWRGTIPLSAGTTVWLGGGDDTVINPSLVIRVNGYDVQHLPSDATTSVHKSAPVLRFAGRTRFRLVRVGVGFLVGLAALVAFMLLKRIAVAPRERMPDKDFSWSPPKQTRPRLVVQAILCFTLVMLGNSHVFTADLLWHDDGFWYATAPSVLANWPSSLAWYSKVSPLAHYRAWLYCFGMVHWGMAWTRALFAAVMGLASALIFLFYVRGLWLPPLVAIPMAVLPNMLPSLIGMPVGLNTTYAVFCLVPMELSVLLYLRTVRFRKNATDAFCLMLSLLFLWICISVSGSGVFLVPCACMFAATTFFAPRQKLFSSFYVFTALGMTIPHALNVAKNGPKQPVNLSLQTMWARFKVLMEESNFLFPGNSEYLAQQSTWRWLAVSILCILGLAYFLTRKKTLLNENGHSNLYAKLLWFMGLCWFPFWMFCNFYAYVASNPDFRPYDYAYIANFGTVALQVLCVFIIVSLVCRMLKKLNYRVTGIVITACIMLSCWTLRQKSSDIAYRSMVVSIKQLKNGLIPFVFPTDSQIVVIGDFTMAHPGNLLNSSGILQYILGRRDIRGLLGSVKPSLHDVFAPYRIWHDSMRGLDEQKPIFVFRKEVSGAQFRQFGHMLRVVLSFSDNCRFEWILVSLDKKTGAMAEVAREKQLALLPGLIKSKGIPPEDIAFYFPEIHDQILDERSAKELLGKNDLPILETYGDVAELLDKSIVEGKDSPERRLLIRIHKTRSDSFIPGIKLRSEVEPKEVSVWTFAQPEDILVLHYPLAPGANVSEIHPSVWNLAPWPWKKIQPLANAKAK